ncbi:ERI1 exoribonuclease 2 isoform X2 [Rhineura floridana]|uniref:ERI1 exoribonuclease 2 isoform X2 n=1 Tax=Rhineura floridana TaxID=261503 RepID=UPI002AC8235B|nr:ERI1 exoribonuclease 2 isoform X2 [Rhineura floridana]
MNEIKGRGEIRQLGIIRRISKISPSGQSNVRPKIRQLFDYLIIIDFESTCWKDGRKCYTQEIIEFPAVLLNTLNGEIESEFHTYVQPQEHPILSEFCTELTGIKQNQVDEGVPLHICLSQFSKWIQKIQKEKNVIFGSGHSSCATSEGKLCAFVTWSDWDLGVCLQYECKRKQLRKPDILNSWIDLRATYKLFYSRKPQGLNGALQDVGIIFAGREHSGLDDSRNTARLAWKMIYDGCVMKITKSLEKAPPPQNSIARFLCVKPTDGSPLGSNDGAKRSCLDESKNAGVTTEIKNKENQQQEFTPVCLHENTHVLSRKGNKTDGYSSVQSCLTPQTGRLNSPLGCFQPSYNSLGIQGGLNNGHPVSHSSAHNPGLVLVSTTLSSVNVSDTDISTTSDCLSMLADWEDVALIPASQDDQNSECSQWVDESNDKSSLTVGEKMGMNGSHVMNLRSESVVGPILNMQLSESVVNQSYSNIISNTGMVPDKFSNASGFKLPTAKASTASTDGSNGNHVRSSSEAHKRKPSSPKSFPPAKKPPFIVYEDKGTTSSNSLLFRRPGSHHVPSGILNSSINLRQRTGTGKVTPPLCKCGRRARRLNVSNGGPNHGKVFYSCPGRKQGRNRKGCGYFIWERTLQKEKCALPPASDALGLPHPVQSCSSSESSERKFLALRPSMRT